MPDFRRNRRRRQLRRQISAITHAGQREIFLGIFAGVIGQAVERVIRRVDGPDDFVERARRFARGLGNLPRVRLDFRRNVLVRFRHFAEQRDLRQIRAELVVQVARDARAFAFERLLLLEQLQFALQFLR